MVRNIIRCMVVVFIFIFLLSYMKLVLLVGPSGFSYHSFSVSVSDSWDTNSPHFAEAQRPDDQVNRNVPKLGYKLGVLDIPICSKLVEHLNTGYWICPILTEDTFSPQPSFLPLCRKKNIILPCCCYSVHHIFLRFTSIYLQCCILLSLHWR